MRHSLWWLLALALFIAPACNDTGGEDTPPDNGDNTGKPGDNGDDDGGNGKDDEKPKGSSKLGDLCDQDDECSSGFCVTIGSGKNEGVCSKRCQEDHDCEIDRWSCRNIATGSGDEVRGCAPQTLCIDNDGDGYGIGPECKGADCDDTDPTVYEGAPEICDGKDNNCDGRVDNDPVDVGHNCNTNLEGVCKDGVSECNNGVLECIQLQMPGKEICDGLDNDCDGLIDESAQNDENGNHVEQIGRACAPDGSSCYNGIYVCEPYEHGGLHCDGLGDNAPEICDGIDNNCNGQIDEGIEGLGDVCIVGHGVCVNASAKICDPNDPKAPPICDVEPDESKKSAEVCDYEDNDCNGVVDDPFVNENGIYYTTEHCGGCDNDCATQWGSDVDPASVHARPTCNVVGESAACSFECIDGYIDMDGVVDNGCELLPDENGIYVATPAKGGADSNDCGSYDAPCATIAKGIERAQAANRKNVRVSDGVFREGVVLKDGINVLGGHSSINWLRDTSVNTTTIYGSAPTFPNDAVAVVARDISSATEFSGFSVTAPDASEGGNSIALFVENSTNKLVIKDNTLQAGVGGQGAVGAAGTDGVKGADGANGVQGVALTSCTSSNELAPPPGGAMECGGIDVSGGQGGGSSCPSDPEQTMQPDGKTGLPNKTAALPTAGQNNSGEFGDAGFSAWVRYGLQNVCTNLAHRQTEAFARDGVPGQTGDNGDAGSGASGNGVLSGSMWRAAKGSTGVKGAAGGGGGGGGAAHSIYRRSGSTGRRYQLGATGGGGGAGGCEGTGAEGGAGGGGSFAMYILGSTLPQAQNNILIRGVGGAGGSGGIGGTGAFGGAGGVGGPGNYSGNSGYNYCSETGRTGGDGGRGGHGGGGGGGAGGNAHDIAFKGASSSAINTLISNNEFGVAANEDTAGQGGDGGPSMGNPGEAGSKGQSGRQFALP